MKPRPLSPGEALVWRVLKRHRTRKRAIKQYALWVEILRYGNYNSDYYPSSTRDVRRIIHDLVEIHGKPIASECVNRHGYYVYSCLRDCDQAIKTLDQYIGPIARRRKALIKQRRRLAGQRRFIFKPQRTPRRRFKHEGSKSTKVRKNTIF